MVDGALKRFAYYEGNKYPEKITDLIPKYLNIARADLPHLNLLSYRRDSKVGYLLSLKNHRGPGINISISPQGIQYESPPGEGG